MSDTSKPASQHDSPCCSRPDIISRHHYVGDELKSVRAHCAECGAEWALAGGKMRRLCPHKNTKIIEPHLAGARRCLDCGAERGAGSMSYMKVEQTKEK